MDTVHNIYFFHKYCILKYLYIFARIFFKYLEFSIYFLVGKYVSINIRGEQEHSSLYPEFSRSNFYTTKNSHSKTTPATADCKWQVSCSMVDSLLLKKNIIRNWVNLTISFEKGLRYFYRTKLSTERRLKSTTEQGREVVDC